MAAPGVVVTNAHVVAGEEDTTVQLRGDGPKLDAHAIAFDPSNDIAVLRVEELPNDARALPLAQNPTAGTPAAILGFPKNGPYRSDAGRLGQTRDGAHRGRLRPRADLALADLTARPRAVG